MEEKYGCNSDVGRKVVVLDGRQYDEYRAAWDPQMDRLVGNAYEIIDYGSEVDAYLIRENDEDPPFASTWWVDADKVIFEDEIDCILPPLENDLSSLF